MNIEYGLITKNMTEKEILQVFNAKLKTFFLEMVDEDLEDAMRQLLTGINVLPSLHPSVNRRNPLRNFIPT